MTKSNKVHTIYKLGNGTRVPSVTTVLGILGKPALIHWAWKCGCDGLDYQKVRDEAADVGTLAHALIMAEVNGKTTVKELREMGIDYHDYSDVIIKDAEICLKKFKEWLKEHKSFKLVFAEQQLVSEKHKFGGTIDCLATIEDIPTLIDFKTGNAVYDEMKYQLAAYMELLKENNHTVTNSRLLRIGRDDNEGFDEKIYNDLSKEWRIFLACREIYELQRKTTE
jgi:hypothetical protein